MSIEKRKSRKTGKVTYRVRLRIGGQEVSSTHDRLSDARSDEAEARTCIASGRWGWAGEARRHTAAEAIDRYLEQLPSARLCDERNRRRQLGWWRKELGDTPLSDCTPARLCEARDKLLSTPVVAQGSSQRHMKRRGAATVVRYLAAISHVFSKAANDWAWMPENPVRKVKKPRQPSGRVRYLNDVERETLLTACRASESATLYPLVLLALTTGMRKGEIVTLKWSNIDLDDASVLLEQTKNGERRVLPISGLTLEALRGLSANKAATDVFAFRGKAADRPVDIAKAWATAVRRAGLTDFRFHDLRHTTASYLAMRGASLLEVGAVLGHKSTQMTKRYAHLSIAHTRKLLGAMVADLLPDAPNSGLESLT